MAIPTDNYKTTSVSYGKKDDVNPPDPVGGTPGQAEPASSQVVFRGSVFVDPVTNTTKQRVKSFGDVNAQGDLVARVVLVETPELPLAASVITFAASASFAASAGELSAVLPLSGGGTGASTLASAQAVLGISELRDASSLQGKIPSVSSVASTIMCRDANGDVVMNDTRLILDSTGNEFIQFVTTGGATHYLRIRQGSSTTGMALSMESSGHIDGGNFRIAQSGHPSVSAGIEFINSLLHRSLQINWTTSSVNASAINYVQIINAASGLDPVIAAIGDGTDINLSLQGKGSGGVNIAVGDLTFTGCGQILAMNGSAGAPAISFASDVDTGFYKTGGAQIGVAASGIAVALFDQALIQTNVPLTALVGSAGGPAYSFAVALGTGMYRGGNNRLSFAVASVLALEFNLGSSTWSIRGALQPSPTGAPHNLGAQATPWGEVVGELILAGSGTAAAPGFAFANDLDNGMFLLGDNTLAFAASGVDVFHASSEGVDILSGDLTLSGSGQILIASGSHTVPGIAFAADPDTGIFASTTGRLQITLGGVEIAAFLSTGIISRKQFFASSGDTTAPGYAFFTDIDTGMDLPATGVLGFSASGDQVVSISGTGLDINIGDLTLSGSGQILTTNACRALPAYSFASDPDTGMYLFNTGVIAFSANTIDQMRIGSSQILILDGSAAIPGIAFISDPDTGMFQGAANRLGFAAGGSGLLFATQGSGVTAAAPIIAKVGVDLSGGDLTLTGCGQILPQSGSVDAPPYAFTTDPDTGMFLGSPGFLRLSASGLIYLAIGGSNVDSVFSFRAPNGAESKPGFAFSSDEDNGMYLVTTNIVGFSAGGSTMLQIDNGSSVTVIAPLVPGTNESFDLGAPGLRWNAVWASAYYAELGTETTPSFTFRSDDDTGIFRSGDNRMSFTAGGSQMLHIANGSSVTIVANLHPGATATHNLGSATLIWNGIHASQFYGIVASAVFATTASAATNAASSIFATTASSATNAASSIFATTASSATNSASADNATTLAGKLPATIATGDTIACRTTGGNLAASRILVSDGTTTAPAISFTSAPAVGFSLGTTGRINLSMGAACNITFASAFTNFSDEIRVPSGASTNPSYTFNGDTNTGMYNPADEQIGFAATGSAIIIITISSLHPGVDLGTNLGTPTFRFNTIHTSAVDATLFRGEATSAQYADLAERYESDNVYDSGTVMIFGGECEITPCTTSGDTRVAGVISTKPGFRMNAKAGADDTHPFLALRGRVPCKVVGHIHKGALLTTSDVSGHAVRAFSDTPHWAVFAKALENHDDEKGTIEVVVL